MVKIEVWVKENPDWLRQFAMPAHEKPLPQMRPASVCLQEKREGVARFRLSYHVAAGVEELDQAKLTPLLKLKYHDSTANAVAARETRQEPP
ncbi:hypothetical protein [Accumulibacter sp.]|uniref:hypothetical protein n=1 Tax=Accumulibacter sp. TaxID=2053492 RepID=UPI0028C39EC6|nr:hypothetical protein [Accumulibacter sp.]